MKYDHIKRNITLTSDNIRGFHCYLIDDFFLTQNTVTLATEDLIEAEEWIIQIQKAIYSIHCQVNVVKGSSITTRIL
jgi:hypothetical protein